MRSLQTVLVTGGAGYVGAVLIPQLLEQGYRVKVLDRYFFGEHVLDTVKHHAGLEQIKGDIRDQELLHRHLPGCDAVIHLACISNDPSFELNPTVSRAINYDAFRPLVHISKASGVGRFIYASSSSVYGVSDEPQVTEEHPLLPITDYNKYKGLCEPILLEYQAPDFTTVIIRPATLCGYSPRQRLDLTVNILTNHAIHAKQITVFGGRQMRPNFHIDDMVDLYLMLLRLPADRIAGQTYNAGYQNDTVANLAETVRDVVEERSADRGPVEIVTTPSDDLRSYHICSDKIKRDLEFEPKRTIQDAVQNLIEAFQDNKIPDSMNDTRYYNIKTMQSLDID